MSWEIAAWPALSEYRSIYLGLLQGIAALGVQTTLFILCFHRLLVNIRSRSPRRRMSIILLLDITLMLVFNWAEISLRIKNSLEGWNFVQDGLSVSFDISAPSPNSAAIYGLTIANACLQDVLLLSRFYVVFGSSPRLLALPGLVFMVILGTGIVSIVHQTEQRSIAYNTPYGYNLAIIFWGLTLALNLVLVTCVCTRLLIQRRRMRSLGDQYAKPYVATAGMCTESSTLVTVFQLAFLITLGTSSPTVNMIMPVLAAAEAIAPLLIIYRISSRQAQNLVGSADAQTAMSSMHFASGAPAACVSLPASVISNYGPHDGEMSLQDSGSPSNASYKDRDSIVIPSRIESDKIRTRSQHLSSDET